ncbi:MAG: flagellin lysine-N-methylase [Lachnospiraceae bacterium]|nr:flagellin lysine-N-methylase [Lachnospiraceae bacterium]
MKIIKPDYYDAFTCSASECSYTCCQEWTIAVDDAHKESWKSLKIPETVQGIAGFSGRTHLSDLVKKVPEGYAIDMGKTKVCPFLNDRKLCEIVLAYGEECISCTCHTFPRKCQSYTTRLEYALDLGCPEALDLLWKKGRFALKEEVMEDLSALTGTEKELMEAATETGEEDSRLFLIRKKAMELIAREDIPLTTGWIMLFGLMLDFYEKGEQLKENYIEEMFSEKVISQLKATVLHAGRDLIDHFTERNELFLDVCENYRKKKLYESVLSEVTDRADWFELTDDDYTSKMYREFEGIWESLESRIRLVMLEGLYSGMLLPGGDLYSMVLKTQWLGLTLTMIRHALFLRYELDEEYIEEKAKALVVVILRMTGYSEADIEEYLEHAFEEIIWSWGYMALIV